MITDTDLIGMKVEELLRLGEKKSDPSFWATIIRTGKLSFDQMIAVANKNCYSNAWSVGFSCHYDVAQLIDDGGGGSERNSPIIWKEIIEQSFSSGVAVEKLIEAILRVDHKKSPVVWNELAEYLLSMDMSIEQVAEIGSHIPFFQWWIVSECLFPEKVILDSDPDLLFEIGIKTPSPYLLSAIIETVNLSTHQLICILNICSGCNYFGVIKRAFSTGKLSIEQMLEVDIRENSHICSLEAAKQILSRNLSDEQLFEVWKKASHSVMEELENKNPHLTILANNFFAERALKDKEERERKK
jgi:hypothetical protein